MNENRRKDPGIHRFDYRFIADSNGSCTMDMVMGYSGMDESMADFNVRKKKKQTSLTVLLSWRVSHVRTD